MSKESIETTNIKGRRLCIGDLHGGLLALKEVMEKAEVTTDDQLIFLGDYVDGWVDSFNLIEYLIGLNETHNCVFLRGNHDAWLEDYLDHGYPKIDWMRNGGQMTQPLYQKLKLDELVRHRKFFNTLHNYYLTDDNIAFVHGGYLGNGVKSKSNLPHHFYWDRNLLQTAVNHESKFKSDSENYGKYFPKKLKAHKEIFVGHTPTQNYDMEIPFRVANLTNMDTGCGYGGGKLSIMDVDSREVWQSSLLKELYPNDPHMKYGRG